MSNPLNSSDEKSYQYNGYGGWSTLSLSSANSSKQQASSYDSILEKLDQKIENIAQIARESAQRDKQIKEQYMSGCIDTLASRNSSTDSKEAEQILTSRRIPKSAREIYPADAVRVGSNEQIDSVGSPLGNASNAIRKEDLLMHGKDANIQVEKLLDRVGQFNGLMKVASTKHKTSDNKSNNARKIFRLEDALREQQQQQEMQQYGSKVTSEESHRRRESDYVFFSWSVYQECKEVYDRSAYVIFTRTDFEAVMESLGQKDTSKQQKQLKVRGFECGLDDSDKENQDYNNQHNRQNSKAGIIPIGQTVENKQQRQSQDEKAQQLRKIHSNNRFKNGQIERLSQPLVVLSNQQNESNRPERNYPEIKLKKKTEPSQSPQSLALNTVGTHHNNSIIHLTTAAIEEQKQQKEQQLFNGFKIIPKDQAARALQANQQPQQIINSTNSSSISAVIRSQSQQSQQHEQLQECQQQTAPTNANTTTYHRCSTTFQSCSSPGSSTSKNQMMASEALTFQQQESYSVGISTTVTPFDQSYTCPSSQSFHLAQRHITQPNSEHNHNSSIHQDSNNSLAANTEETNKSLRRESSITRLLKAKIIQRDHNHHSVDAPRSPISLVTAAPAVVQNHAYIDVVSDNNNNIITSSSNSSNTHCRIGAGLNEQLTILSSPSSLPLKLKPHLPSDSQPLRLHSQSNSTYQLTPQLPAMNTHKISISSHCSIPKPAIISRQNNSQSTNISIIQRQQQQQDKQEQQVQQSEGMKIIGIRKRSNYSFDRQITIGEKQVEQQQQQTHFNYAKRQIQRAESTVSINNYDSRNNNSSITNQESNINPPLPYTHSRQQQQEFSQNTICNPQYLALAPNTAATTVSRHQVLSMKPRCFSYDRLSTFSGSSIPNSKQPPYPSILS